MSCTAGLFSGFELRTAVQLVVKVFRNKLNHRGTRGQGKNHFPCSAEQDWQPYPVDSLFLLYVMPIHTYIHIYSSVSKFAKRWGVGVRHDSNNFHIRGA